LGLPALNWAGLIFQIQHITNMKTEYRVRTSNGVVCGPWTKDIGFFRENFRDACTNLWRRETETPEEAAVRRMAALEKSYEQGTDERRKSNECFSTFADRLSPPPAATECQVDWDTLEPVKEVPVWQGVNGVWVAGVEKDEFQREDDGASLGRLTGFFGNRIPTAAIGSTRENALRNLAELQQIKTK